MFRPTLRALPLVFVLAAAPGCGDDTPTAPTTPTVPSVTDTFSGTLNVNGAAVHTFTTAGPGTMSATLTAVGPDSETVMGLALGEWNGSSCALIVSNVNATTASVVFGTVTRIGTLCVHVHDVGHFTASTTYELSVTHP